jgi:hypothetical protein
MAVTLTGTGGLFTRLGKLFGLAKTIRTHQRAIAPTAATATDGVRAIFSAYASTAGTLPMATDLVRALTDEDMLANASTGALVMLRTAAERTLIEMVDADTELPRKTVEEAVRELAKQMVASSDSVVQTTYTVGSPSYGSANVGNARIIVSTEACKIIKDGVTFSTKLLDYPCIRAETLTFNCMRDSRAASLTRGEEVWHITGERSYPNLDRRWRTGSGTSMMLPGSTAAHDAGGGPAMNVLTNSDFEVWESNLPVQFTLTTGTAGTHVASTSTAMRGNYALRLLGDGSTLTTLRQRFTSSDGTHGRIMPDTLYLISLWVRHDGTAPAAGVLQVACVDGSGSTLGSSMFCSVTLTGVSSTYAHFSASMVSPIDVPSTAYLQIKLTTALSNGREVYVDEVMLLPMARLAAGGPAVAIVAGSTDSVRGDLATVAISTSTSGEFNLEFDRMFGLYESGLALPASASTSATISDTLVA